MIKKLLLFAIFSIFAFIQLQAQSVRKNANFQMHIKKATSSVKIDGLLNEKTWEQAALASDFYMCNPFDTLCANVRTDVRMAYDDKYLYISAECFLQPGQPFVVESLKRDFNFSANDNFLVFIDTFDDKTTGFSFGANAAGAQWDGQMSEGAKMNLNWDNKWESSTTYNSESWIWEAAIPFKSIRYKDNSKIWGINFSRLDTRQKEKSAWAPVPRQFPTASLAFAGALVWETPPPAPKKNISIIPYILSGNTIDFENNKNNSRNQIGGDIKVAVTSSLNLDLTLNPDFSQVDVDRQQTNLDRFELFYPEKRQFFIENSDLFDGFGTETIRPFFSRRIGLAYNNITKLYEQTPITYGARLSGKLTKDWRIGVLNVQAAKVDSAANPFIPSQNFSMVAFQRKIFSRSNLGFFFINKNSIIEADSQRTKYKFNDFSRTIGFEYNLASSNNFWIGKTFFYKTIGSKESSRNFAHALNLSYKDNDWIAVWRHQWVGEGFNPEVGYVPRVNYFNINPEFGKIFYPKNKQSKLFYAQTKAMVIGYWDIKGNQTDNTNVVMADFVMKDRSSYSIWTATDYIKLLYDFDATRVGNEKLKTGSEHTWKSIGFNFMSSAIKKFTYSFTSRFGGYYANGARTGITSELAYRFQPYVNLSVALDYNNITDVELKNELGVIKRKLNAEFWIIRPKVDITFTNKLFFTTYLQINQQTKNVNLNSRIQWRYKPASDIFLVYTDNYFPETMLIRNRSIVLKLNYWLNL
ncbi:MAG: hypothetical protein RJA76_1291 [Bacteroidota bacterium]|jgi:hypothetical protein